MMENNINCYKISSSQDEKYLAIIFSLSIENPLNSIFEIEKDFLLDKRGIILFDLFLCNGKGFNRYGIMTFNGNYINKKSFKIESKISQTIKDQSYNFYKLLNLSFDKNFENSILSDNDIASLKMSFEKLR